MPRAAAIIAYFIASANLLEAFEFACVLAFKNLTKRAMPISLYGASGVVDP
jgi:hypothetical protein